MAGMEMATEILREIRDEIRKVRTEIRGIRSETIERFGMVDSALLDLVDAHGHGARPTKTAAEREGRIEPRLADLELRLDKLESK